MAIDVVIPAHNEAGRIGPTLWAYRRRLSGDDTRFWVALDGCTDDTEAVVETHAQDDPRVRALRYPKLGKGGVLNETFRRCDADLIGFVDADGATPPGEFLRLVELAQRADGAIASRRHPTAVLAARRPPSRVLTSVAFARGVRHVFRLPYADTQCGAKVFRREVVERALPYLSARDFLFDVDLLLTARRLGYQVTEVPTVWIHREGSRLHAGRDAWLMALCSFRLWLHHRLLPVPGRGTEPAFHASSFDLPEGGGVGAHVVSGARPLVRRSTAELASGSDAEVVHLGS